MQQPTRLCLVLNNATVGAEDTSQTFIGQWNRLISTTNWEKGRIVHEWRGALMESGAGATDHSDEAWSQMVGVEVEGWAVFFHSIDLEELLALYLISGFSVGSAPGHKAANMPSRIRLLESAVVFEVVICHVLSEGLLY